MDILIDNPCKQEQPQYHDRRPEVRTNALHLKAHTSRKNKAQTPTFWERQVQAPHGGYGMHAVIHRVQASARQHGPVQVNCPCPKAKPRNKPQHDPQTDRLPAPNTAAPGAAARGPVPGAPLPLLPLAP